MQDTIPHIIDSTRQIINVIVPGKSNFEMYAPYVAVFVSLLTVAVNIWLNNRQIRNAQRLQSENLKITTGLKLLEEYRSHRLNTINALSILDDKKYNEKRNDYIDKVLRLFSIEYNLLHAMKTVNEDIGEIYEIELQLQEIKIKDIKEQLDFEGVFLEILSRYSRISLRIIDRKLYKVLTLQH